MYETQDGVIWDGDGGIDGSRDSFTLGRYISRTWGRGFGVGCGGWVTQRESATATVQRKQDSSRGDASFSTLHRTGLGGRTLRIGDGDSGGSLSLGLLLAPRAAVPRPGWAGRLDG